MQATRKGSAQRMCSPVFAGHQGKVQQLTTGESGANAQPGSAAFQGVHVIIQNGDLLIERQLCIRNHKSSHELGQ